jgi:histidyl-tRNA synthetase
LIKAIKGTRDILPEEINYWQWVERTAADVFQLYCYSEMRNPIFEETQLFTRSTGEETDIVQKEMYTFEDKSGKSITLRPEGTPSILRAYIEHQLEQKSPVSRYYYIGPMFRYERPQKGRYRQFQQIGAEALCEESPAIDAEQIDMLFHLLNRLGLSKADLILNSIGCPKCRPAYLKTLEKNLRAVKYKLCPTCQERFERNMLRIFDCKEKGCQNLIDKAPKIIDHLCPECENHFTQLKAYLKELSIPYQINPRLVRGLDYYTRTTYEFTYPGLGAQNSILGGGRYDELIEQLGGPPTPAIGFAIGVDRLILAIEKENINPPLNITDFSIIPLGKHALLKALHLAHQLRQNGFSCYYHSKERSLKAELRQANRMSSQAALIVGEDELKKGVVLAKRMSDGKQKEIELKNLIPQLRSFINDNKAK